jgi:hypothetical protein
MNASSAALARALDAKRTLAGDAAMRAGFLFQAGKLDEARSGFAAAQRLYLELGDELQPAWLRTKIALIDLEEGHPKAAETNARDALAHIEKLAPDSMRHYLRAGRQVLVLTLFAQGQTQAARAELDRALAIDVPMDFDYRELLSITQARLLAAEGRRDAAQELLEQVRAEAARGHYKSIELDARRAQIELQAALGADSSVRADARALADEAAKLGFGLIANNMAKLSQRE